MDMTNQYYEGQEVEILFSKNGEFVVSPIAGETDERFFAHKADLQERPEKDQEKTSFEPGKDQTRTRERPLAVLARTTPKPSIEIAREHLPEKTLVQEICEKWDILEVLQMDVYSGSELSGFDELLIKVERGELKVCPRPVKKQL